MSDVDVNSYVADVDPLSVRGYTERSGMVHIGSYFQIGTTKDDLKTELMIRDVASKEGVKAADTERRERIRRAVARSTGLENTVLQCRVPSTSGLYEPERLQFKKFYNSIYDGLLPVRRPPLQHLASAPLHFVVIGLFFFAEQAILECLEGNGVLYNPARLKLYINYKHGFHRQNAVTLACRRGFYSIVRYLLRQGGDVHMRDRQLWTPLMYAAAGGHELLCEELVAHGAKLEDVDGSNETPLFHAVHHQQDRVVARLLRMGANPNVCNAVSSRAEAAWCCC